ncbi:hypothetical protein GGR58DRAFT_516652 [Xylaria digitata]|nr:hypothetical protein GGR58DRAFT_516652 [Xylaria digitata]
MALELHIPPCICTPAHPFHFPSLDRPLRIQIEGPLTAIRRFVFPMPGGKPLAELTYRALYGADVRTNIYAGNEIDYYGVTFDHLVPADDLDPDVLQINICEMDYDGGEGTNKHLLFLVNPADYTGKKVLAVPRCCQKRKGTQDRGRVNDGVNRDRSSRQCRVRLV